MQLLKDFWNKNQTNKIVAIISAIFIVCCLCTLCSSVISAASNNTPSTRQKATESNIQAAATDTPQGPTETPQPTDTPAPTDTPEPTFTPTPLPEPIILTGNGDNVVDLQKWDGPAILKATYNGGGNFIVTNFDGSNNQIDLLVNTIGNYTGTLPLDFYDNQQTARFQITASGPWELQIIPFQQARKESVPTTITGTGDEVVILTDNVPDLLKITANQASRNFIVMAYGSDGQDLLVNEIAPYTGTVMAPSGTYVIVITATGPWSIEVTTK